METTTTPPLRDLAKRVRRGSALLDKKLPGWRRVLYRALTEDHRKIQMADGGYCVLGTIEHYIGRLRRRPRAVRGMAACYSRGVERLGLTDVSAEYHGFLSQNNTPDERRAVYAILDELWRGEIEAGV